MAEGQRVEDGRLIRQPKLPRESIQAYWNAVGWKRQEIHCAICGDSAVGNLAHYGGDHQFKAKIPTDG